MFTVALFIIAKMWQQPKCPSTLRNEQTKCGLSIQQNTIQPLKGMKYFKSLNCI